MSHRLAQEKTRLRLFKSASRFTDLLKWSNLNPKSYVSHPHSASWTFTCTFMLFVYRMFIIYFNIRAYSAPCWTAPLCVLSSLTLAIVTHCKAAMTNCVEALTALGRPSWSRPRALTFPAPCLPPPPYSLFSLSSRPRCAKSNPQFLAQVFVHSCSTFACNYLHLSI